MQVEQQASLNVYPSPQSGGIEYIATLPNGKRLAGNQAHILHFILEFPNNTPLASTQISRDIGSDQPHMKSVPLSMQRLEGSIAPFGGLIETSNFEPTKPYTYRVHLPEDVRKAIKVDEYQVPISKYAPRESVPTFHLPNGKVAELYEAAALHELVKDHLTPETTIGHLELFRSVFGNRPYDRGSVINLLAGIDDKLEGTGIKIEGKGDKEYTDSKGNIRHVRSSVFLNLSGYITKLRAETEELRKPTPFEFTDLDILAFAELLSAYGSEGTLKKYNAYTPLIPSALYFACSEIAKYYKSKGRQQPNAKTLLPGLKEKMLQMARADKKKVEGSRFAKEIFAVFEGINGAQMSVCINKLYDQHSEWRLNKPDA